MTKALYPGSFDPFTVAHEEIVRKALTIFDKVVVGIGYNISKSGFLPIEEREAIINEVFKDDDRVEVVHYNTLTIDLCHKMDIKHIVRGVRSYTDFESENNLADINSILAPEIITIYLTTSPKYSAVSSTAVREIIKFGSDPSFFLSKGITIKIPR
ncbi:MAG: pantetheine-phosphate adenylyltransferase [Rikenellaceae bacterium]